jgi:hypothetical protein
MSSARMKIVHLVVLVNDVALEVPDVERLAIDTTPEDFGEEKLSGKTRNSLRSFRRENGFTTTFDFGELNHRHS